MATPVIHDLYINRMITTNTILDKLLVYNPDRHLGYQHMIPQPHIHLS